MKITNVTASVHRVPIRVPLIDQDIPREIVFVRVETDEGITGYGMTSQILRWSVREFINRELGPFVKGKNALDTEAIWHDAYWKFNQRGTSGAVMSGISALDIALWDAKGKYPEAAGMETTRRQLHQSPRVHHLWSSRLQP